MSSDDGTMSSLSKMFAVCSATALSLMCRVAATPVGEHRRVDAVDEVAQVRQRLLGVPADVGQEFEGAVGVAVQQPGGAVERHAQRHEPDLRAVVQIPFDALQFGGLRVQGLRPRVGQPYDPAFEPGAARRGEQDAAPPFVQGQGGGGAAAGDRRPGAAAGGRTSRPPRRTPPRRRPRIHTDAVREAIAARAVIGNTSPASWFIDTARAFTPTGHRARQEAAHACRPQQRGPELVEREQVRWERGQALDDAERARAEERRDQEGGENSLVPGVHEHGIDDSVPRGTAPWR